MNTKNSIHILYRLIEANKSRIAGYDLMIKQTGDNDLKSLFLNFSHTSRKNNNELLVEVSELKNLQNNQTKIANKLLGFFKNYSNKKIRLNTKDILNTCVSINQKLIKKYEKILNEKFEFFSVFQQALIKNQLNLLHNDANVIKNMIFKLK